MPFHVEVVEPVDAAVGLSDEPVLRGGDVEDHLKVVSEVTDQVSHRIFGC